MRETKLKDKDSIVHIFLYVNQSGASTDELLQKTAKSLIKFRARPFAPKTKRAEAFLKGEVSASGITFKHSELTDPMSIMRLSAMSNSQKSYDFISAGFSFRGLDDQMDLQWEFGRKLVKRWIKEFDPVLIVMNTASLGSESSFPTPKMKNHIGPKLPSHLLPLTYLGPEKLSADIRKKLAKLPAACSEPIGKGWIVEVIDNSDDRSTEKISAALKKQFPGTLYYGPRH